jgi:hypothetical protein
MIETSFLLAIQERIAKNNNDSNICVERECNLPTAALLFPIRFFRAKTAGTEHIIDNQNTFEFATKALGDCTYSMQSGYPTQFHGMNRGCVVRATFSRNANTAVGMNATVTPVRVIRLRPRYLAAKSSRARRRR